MIRFPGGRPLLALLLALMVNASVYGSSQLAAPAKAQPRKRQQRTASDARAAAAAAYSRPLETEPNRGLDRNPGGVRRRN